MVIVLILVLVCVYPSHRFSLLLRLKPLANSITVPFLARDSKAIEIVQVILECSSQALEDMHDNSGRRIVELPARKVTVDTLHFTPAEHNIYDSICNAVKRNFDQLNAKALVGKNYIHILAMIMKLRWAVLHPVLVTGTSDGTETKLSGYSKEQLM
ncbi:uncharacterized protein BJ212DRAFT_1481055 [Suillus subaureus]|uniref:Uncharacterized protein n=1 Tax=Suillus subaureus TaxID=48587 RepID=A0A9P7EAA7_9AGAM|nr:uncharacterized protein BJ212DRAFT_1481055 [Suillus subaureus]KAG1815992.1 hypothetical protein BJ212DRAFT_1481055 [Suillus subaureus]